MRWICCLVNSSLVHFQNKTLKKQIAKETAKSSQLENEVQYSYVVYLFLCDVIINPFKVITHTLSKIDSYSLSLDMQSSC